MRRQGDDQESPKSADLKHRAPLRWERDAGTVSDGRRGGGADEALEEQRFPEAAQTLGKGRGWRRGGRGGRGGRGAWSGRWEQPGAERSAESAWSPAGTPFPARLPHTLPSFPSRLHRPESPPCRGRAVAPRAAPCERDPHHRPAARPGCEETSGCSQPIAAGLPALCPCRRPAGAQRCPGPA